MTKFFIGYSDSKNIAKKKTIPCLKVKCQALTPCPEFRREKRKYAFTSEINNYGISAQKKVDKNHSHFYSE